MMPADVTVRVSRPELLLHCFVAPIGGGVCSAPWAARSDLHRAGGPGGASDERLKVNRFTGPGMPSIQRNFAHGGSAREREAPVVNRQQVHHRASSRRRAGVVIRSRGRRQRTVVAQAVRDDESVVEHKAHTVQRRRCKARTWRRRRRQGEEMLWRREAGTA